jgi:hypothetical protein
MSDLQSKLTGVKFDPVDARKPQRPGEWILLVGVLYPIVVIGIELYSRMCAEAFFDPMPTLLHTFAVAFVPASNLLMWVRLQHDTVQNTKWLAFANGAAIAIAGFYALLFLPVAPIAFVAIFAGIGLLPLAPLACFVCALKLRKMLRAKQKEPLRAHPLLAGLAAGLALLLVLDVPAAATRLGIQLATSNVPSERERGLTLLRTLGDDDLLLRLCYGTVAKPTGLLSALVVFGGNILGESRQQFAQSPAEAREIYYRVHGVAFNARPAPYEKGKWSRFADFQFDTDHGGTEVGGRLKGLDIVSSRIDGSISGDDAVAYLEWTVEFRNTGLMDREARLQLALPPGGVVSRATLWVNGEEREAAYGGRAEVRAAYQRVAVQQRRDPLLVTTKGGDRVLAQAFPVPRNGGTIKFKLGITAPLEMADDSKASLMLPAIVDRNFSFAAGTSHSVWIESKEALSTSAPGLTTNRTGSRAFRISGAIDDRALARTRQAISVARVPNTSSLVAQVGEGDRITQEITMRPPQTPTTLMLVIDGSARLGTSIKHLIAALDAIPSTVEVGAVIASEPARPLTPAAWSEAQKNAVVELLRSTSFVGGQDNAPALATALQVLEAEPNAQLLWIHGPQPVSFRGSAARLEQATSRLSHLPDVTLYSVEPGPNEVLPDAPWAWGARLLPQTGEPQADLSAFFARLAGTAVAIRRAQAGTQDGFAKGSDHIARLWANDRVLELMRTDPAGNRVAAVALATQYRLVTPISGAVVLETKQQYDESRLTPVSQATVPTIPEPHEWALLLMACAALGWFLLQRRRQSMAAA